MKDIIFNYDKWKRTNTILYITGNSGAGKSTLAERMQKENIDVEYFNLDIFFLAAKTSKSQFMIDIDCLPITDELKKIIFNYFNNLSEADFDYYKPPKMNYSKFVHLANLANNFVTIAEKEIKNHNYIFESSVLYMQKPAFYIDKPIILLGTSYWKSSWRGIKRAIKRKVSFKKFCQIFYNRILTMFSRNNSLYLQHLDYNIFRDELIELMDNNH